MEELTKKLQNLSENLKNYAKTRIDLAIVSFSAKATNVAAGILTSIGILFFGALAFLFACIALAIWLGGILNSLPLGFLIVAGFFILIIIILYLLRRKIIFPIIRNKIIRKYYESD